MKVEARLETDKKLSSILRQRSFCFFSFAFAFVNPLPSKRTKRSFHLERLERRKNAEQVSCLICACVVLWLAHLLGLATILKNPIKEKTREAEIAASMKSK